MIDVLRRFAPLPAVLLGLLAARRAGVPVTAFAPNLVGILIGAFSLWFVERRAFNATAQAPAISVVALLSLAATFAFEGVDDVHRWIWLGPLSLNVGVAVTPILAVGFAALLGKSTLRAGALLMTAMALFSQQPDAGQAAVMAAGLVAIAATARDVSLGRRVAWSTVAVTAAALCFLRPDDVEPVLHVEKILPLLVSHGLVSTFAMLLALATLVAPFWFNCRMAEERRYAIFETTFVLASIAVTFTGNFPTPVFGAGLAGVISWYALELLRPRRHST